MASSRVQWQPLGDGWKQGECGGVGGEGWQRGSRMAVAMGLCKEGVCLATRAGGWHDSGGRVAWQQRVVWGSRREAKHSHHAAGALRGVGSSARHQPAAIFGYTAKQPSQQACQKPHPAALSANLATNGMPNRHIMQHCRQSAKQVCQSHARHHRLSTQLQHTCKKENSPTQQPCDATKLNRLTGEQPCQAALLSNHAKGYAQATASSQVY